jgi:hypothetical protein
MASWKFGATLDVQWTWASAIFFLKPCGPDSGQCGVNFEVHNLNPFSSPCFSDLLPPRKNA